jgi:Homeodomain-like domain
MDKALSARRAELTALTKQDGDPKVRHRAHALLDLLDSPSVHGTATRLAVSAKSLGRWRIRFLAEGGAGLRDLPRSGRPPTLPMAARALLETALTADPMDHGYPVTTWTMVDLTDLLARRGWIVSTATVNRTVHALGYVHRRPRHDLHHRQDAEAVASAQHVLETLQKKGLITAAEFASCISTSANSTPILTWQKPGDAGANRAGFPRREPTGA